MSKAIAISEVIVIVIGDQQGDRGRDQRSGGDRDRDL